MSTLSLRLPESLHKSARELAEKENISINQLITLALAEKIAALGAEDYLEARAKRTSKKKSAKPCQRSPRLTLQNMTACK
jgi:hypothetical protein